MRDGLIQRGQLRTLSGKAKTKDDGEVLNLLEISTIRLHL